MRHAAMLVAILTLASLNACELVTGPEELTMHVQGTVTAAGDGSPIAGATVLVGKFLRDQATQVQTNNQGDYSLSFIDTACSESFFLISASADGFRLLLIASSSQDDTIGVRCTEEVQTIDFQLVRDPT